MHDMLFEALEELYPEMVTVRRDLHMHPELSFQEVRTPQLIAEHFEKLGIEYRTDAGGNGVVGFLNGGYPGPTVALRADFDALALQDEKEVDYKSQIDGVAHACGHDLHTSALMAVEKVLSANREHLNGNVVFIHQHGEELPPGGAQAMIKDGVLNGVDYVYGAHVWTGDSIGSIGFREGYTMAGGDNFEIVIQGKGAHGAMPHSSIDPLVTASQLVVNLQQIISRRIDPKEAGVLTVGKFRSGEAMNIIPDTASISGTTRAFNSDVKKYMESQIHLISQTTAEQAGATADVKITHGYDAVWNHPEETKHLKLMTEKFITDASVFDKTSMMTAEDFAYYLQNVPGSFFFVGGRNPDLNAVYPHHHPKFDVDEHSMIHIGKVFILAVLHHLTAPGGESFEQ